MVFLGFSYGFPHGFQEKLHFDMSSLGGAARLGETLQLPQVQILEDLGLATAEILHPGHHLGAVETYPPVVVG